MYNVKFTLFQVEIGKPVNATALIDDCNGTDHGDKILLGVGLALVLATAVLTFFLREFSWLAQAALMLATALMSCRTACRECLKALRVGGGIAAIVINVFGIMEFLCDKREHERDRKVFWSFLAFLAGNVGLTSVFGGWFTLPCLRFVALTVLQGIGLVMSAFPILMDAMVCYDD